MTQRPPDDGADDEGAFGALVHAAGLPEGHPDRQAAEAWAETGRDARRELASARRLDDLLDLMAAESTEPAPSDDVLDRIAARVLDEMDATEPAVAPTALGLSAWIPAVAALAIWGLLGRRAMAGGAPLESLLESAGLALVGVGALVVGVSFARGRLGAWLLAVVLATSALYAAAVSVGIGPFGLTGAKCIVVELGGAAVPLGLLGVLYAYRGLRPGALRFATVAASGALTAQAAVELGCPAGGGAAHMLTFHVGGVVLAAALGALASRLVPRGPGAARSV